MSDEGSDPVGPPASEPAAGQGSDPSGDTGLFGKLPRTRPGTRSPRRASGATAAKAQPAPAKPRATPPKPRAQPKPQRGGSDPRRSPRDEPARGKGSDPEAEEGAGLEELAWAGIAVTAEAATLGVRLMSRALDAARRAAERG